MFGDFCEKEACPRRDSNLGSSARVYSKLVYGIPCSCTSCDVANATIYMIELRTPELEYLIFPHIPEK